MKYLFLEIPLEGIGVIAALFIGFSLLGLWRSNRRLKKTFPEILEAGAKRDLDAFKEALKNKKLDINAINLNRTTPLIYAVSTFGQKYLVQEVLEKGALIDWQDLYGNSALHHAARGSKKNLIKLLLEHGANTSLKNEEGKTPLDIVTEKGKQDLIDLLS
jgi:ankyrin repeat protein